MTKQEILDRLSIVDKDHIQKAIKKLEEEGIPANRGSYLYDVVDPETGNKYPPPYLLETAYKIATKKNLPKRFFDKIRRDGPHFERVVELGYLIVPKDFDGIDTSHKIFGFKWLYGLSTNQWNKVLDAGKLILDHLDLKTDDPKLVVSFRDDAKKRMAILIGSKYVGGFYLEKNQLFLRFFVNDDFDITSDKRLLPDKFEFANEIGQLVYLKLEDWQGEDDPLCQRILNDISEYYKIAPNSNWLRNHVPFMVDVIRRQEPRRSFLSLMRQGAPVTHQNDVNYWVFQGNPKRYDFEAAIKNNGIDTWTVSAHRDKMEVGDKVIFWITGDRAGCYALGEISKEPFENNETNDEYWKEEDTSDWKAGITITHNLVNNPIDKKRVSEEPALSDLKAGMQGSNFSATKEEYETLLAMIEENTNYKAEFENWLNRNHSESSNMISSYLRAMDLLNGVLDYNLYDTADVIRLRDLYNELIESQDDPEQKYLAAGPVSYGKNKFYSAAVRKYITFHEQRNNSSEMSSNNNQPINQILYGPPGTGKTFYLKEELFPIYTSQETSLSKEQYFEQKVQELTWWQVAALALMEQNNSKVSEIESNRWVSKKAAMSESKNVRATIWGTLQMHTINESDTVAYTQRQAPLIFDKNKDKTWNLLEQEAKELVPELYELLDEVNNFNPNPDKLIKRFTFCTFHQSYSYEDFIEGIKPVMLEEGEQGKINYKIQEGVFKEICRKAENDPENRYAIFIDEINRGNVASIFGELITLIESDKRIAAVNEMRLTLPYSKKQFGVPKNLDIYGTMNTADRSVEALDTALRRRFSFVERMPDPELLEEMEIEGIKLQNLLETINTRIESLVDRDHTIGHAYLINVKNMQDLRAAFKDKIIPLLQEYFYGDYGKIGLVLGKGFVDVEVKEETIFSNFDYEGRESLGQTSYTLKSFDEIDFKEALEQLF